VQPAAITFVVGAGASHSYGLPLGNHFHRLLINHTLEPASLDAIKKHLEEDSNRDWSSELAIADLDPDKFKDQFSRSQLTIDRFIESNPQFEIIGKTAIAKTLLNAEKEPPLIRPEESLERRVPRQTKSPGLQHRVYSSEDNWLRYLYRSLLPNKPKRKHGNSQPTFVEETQVNFILFNYDRLIEEFFTSAISS